ncbi:MAG: hypothetical protein R2681_17320 [Pyrinomonadaceae bacterium]
MKTSIFILSFLFLFSTANAQWQKQDVKTDASFRGLDVVSEKIVWASGTGGTVIRSTDGGENWDVIKVPGAEKLDFRDIEAFDANTAYILSIGNGESSRIYKTTDGGKNWVLQFTNKVEAAFFDSIAFWDKNNGMAQSDPVDGKYYLVATKDGGKTWTKVDTGKMAPAKEGEAAFAASGTSLITHGKNDVYIVSGGNDARVFRSNNRGLTWFVSDTPITKGTPGSGIFGIAMRDKNNGVIVGGNYEKPDEAVNNLAFTKDGGKTWTAGKGLSGYRSGVWLLEDQYMVVVGTNGIDISFDGAEWTQESKESLNSVDGFVEQYNKEASTWLATIWAVGPKGMVLKKGIGQVVK